ncbi:uncharacterized protein LOC115454188 isoform X2 [Manduca sexta]|uniref:uncharacterized protein LOC115454188 isoform X2 n=1 Tax=Manduca sexta TaxID=7130 RepID=UPI0018907300|nr:uncharacterized protein LOC115454188 isoform X2 [Manduca sexta]
MFQRNCVLSLREDFGHPPPMYIRDGGYLEPNGPNGTIVFQSTEKVLVACPGHRNHVVIRYGNGTKIKKPSVVEAACLSGHQFKLEETSVPFQNISCYSASTVSVKRTKEKCGKGGLYNIYGVGYEIIDKFYSLYDACFNDVLMTTYFVRHVISPLNIYTQRDSRPYFKEGGLFKTVSMSSIYKLENQKATFDAILGANEHKKYFHNRQFLSRGHLAPRADFTLLAELRATFQYVNTAPQWQRNNAGPWAALEDSLRRHVGRLGSPVRVVTGTHGILTLPDQHGVDREMYLHTDQNNNYVVPVPMYFYKVVQEQGRPTVAYVTINSSYNSTIMDSLRFCEDICGLGHWLHWKKSRESFCCLYHEFQQVVDYLPSLN